MSNKQYIFLIVVIIATGVGIAAIQGLHFITLHSRYTQQFDIFEAKYNTDYKNLSTRLEDLAQMKIIAESQKRIEASQVEIIEILKETRNLPVTQLPSPYVVEDMVKIRKQLIEIRRQLIEINQFIYKEKGGQSE